MKLTRKLLGDEDERAVSPVIGVILMVAITVILAAVIAAFVLDLGQSQSANVNAGVNIQNSSDEVSFQITDMGNADEVYVVWDDAPASTDFDAPPAPATASCAGTVTDDTCELSGVGDSATHDHNNESFTVIAVSGDNENVINNHP